MQETNLHLKVNAPSFIQSPNEIENVLKDKSPEATVKKKDGECKRILQNMITLYTPIGGENEQETVEEKVARVIQDERHATKRDSACERHEVLMQELEWKVEQLSDQVQSL